MAARRPMKQAPSLIDGTRSPNLVIFSLSWPVILDQTFHTLMGYVDTAMVGSLGAAATASVAVTASTMWLLMGIMYAFGSAYSILIARAIGAQDQEKITRGVQQSILAIVILSFVITTLVRGISGHLPRWMGVEPLVAPMSSSYLSIVSFSFPFFITFVFFSNIIRTSGDTKTPLISNVFTNILNVIGNFFLIFPSRVIHIAGQPFDIWGAGLGVEGAAIATLTSRIVSALILLCVMLFRENAIRIRFKGFLFHFEKGYSRQVLTIALPMAAERATLSTGQIVLTGLASSLGTASLAAHHLAITAESITFMPVSGFSLAAATLVAQSLGAGKKEMARDFARRVLTGGILLMSLAGVLLYIFSYHLLGLFTPDEQVIRLGGKVLRIEAFAQPFFAMSIVISGILRGAGDTRWPFIYSVIGMWGVRLFPAFIFVTFFDGSLMVLWVCMVGDLVVRGLLNFYRYRTGSWIEFWESRHQE
ncbi:MAG: MATE family efflux transporter [Sphaerochaetaceae bacterium]|nr:MATE family efflux transporter [Sphaerochaetaceae bacterium]